MKPWENQDAQHEQSAQRQTEREEAARRIEAGDRPWEEEQPGLRSVLDAVRDLEFPLTADELRHEAGDRVVHTSKQGEWRLEEILGKLKQDEFATFNDFERAVIRHWEGIRYMETRAENRPGGAHREVSTERTRREE